MPVSEFPSTLIGEEQASEHHRDIMIKRANSVNEYTWRYVL